MKRLLNPIGPIHISHCIVQSWTSATSQKQIPPPKELAVCNHIFVNDSLKITDDCIYFRESGTSEISYLGESSRIGGGTPWNSWGVLVNFDWAWVVLVRFDNRRFLAIPRRFGGGGFLVILEFLGELGIIDLG